MKALLKKIQNWNLDRKLIWLISAVFTLVFVIVVSINVYWYSQEANQQMMHMVEEQMYYLEDSYENALNICKGQAVALMMEDSIQKYLLSEGQEDPGYHNKLAKAREVLTAALNTSPDMNYIAVFSNNFDDYLYRGNVALGAAPPDEVLALDYENGLIFGSNDETRLTYGEIACPGIESMTLYFPVYSTVYIGKELGRICMNYSKGFMHSLHDTGTHYNDRMDVFLMDRNGYTFPNAKREKFGQSERVTGNAGSFRADHRQYTYQKLKNNELYLISEVRFDAFFQTYRIVMLVIIGVLFLAVAACVFIVRVSVRHMYNNMDVLVSAMEEVDRGHIDFRIAHTAMGEDFQKLESGFNYMMQQVENLIDEVKEEQKQKEKLHFNVLQEQIKPHFLYNALECIHWQARMGRNDVVSDMVQALARYYRGSLSGGKEIVTLGEELKILEHYVFIQNMRFDNIVRMETYADEEALSIPIPKLTLQPLVENTINHGTAKKSGNTVCITIRACREADRAVITMEDNGKGMDPEKMAVLNRRLKDRDEGEGYGILNVHKRIGLLCGEEYGLWYSQNDPQGVCVRISLPWRELS